LRYIGGSYVKTPNKGLYLKNTKGEIGLNLKLIFHFIQNIRERREVKNNGGAC
jgi:hypothetical protein